MQEDVQSTAAWARLGSRRRRRERSRAARGHTRGANQRLGRLCIIKKIFVTCVPHCVDLRHTSKPAKKTCLARAIYLLKNCTIGLNLTHELNVGENRFKFQVLNCSLSLKKSFAVQQKNAGNRCRRASSRVFTE